MSNEWSLAQVVLEVIIVAVTNSYSIWLFSGN